MELLKSGLYEEYFADLKKMGVPFLPYETYGRSPLENSSFLVSSANFNEKIHGKGFVARLSGSTAEFLQMWELMMNGEKLFTMQDGVLTFKLAPAIPAYLVKDDGKVEATLFGKIKVVYNCGGKRDLIPGQYAVKSYALSMEDGTTKQVDAAYISGEPAEEIRNGVVRQIDVTLA